MIGKVPNGTTLWCFTDCCHSGSMIDLKYNYKSLCSYKKGSIPAGLKYNSIEWSDKFQFYMQKSKDVNGNVYLFSGCQDEQTSADAYINNVSQGAFSFCFIEFLKSKMQKMPDGSMKFPNGTIKIHDVLKEINGRLQINGFEQHSELSTGKAKHFEKTLDL